MTGPTLRRNSDRSGYLVSVAGTEVGEVWVERRASNRYRYEGGSAWNRGRNRWVNSRCNHDEWTTRKEALADLLERL